MKDAMKTPLGAKSKIGGQGRREKVAQMNVIRGSPREEMKVVAWRELSC